MAEQSPTVLVSVALISALGGGGIAYFGDRFWPKNTPPIVHLTVTPNEGPAPLKIALDGNGTHDPDGQPLELQWSIDGAALAVRGLALGYELTQAKPYAVELVARDPGGLVGQAAATVVVKPGFELGAFLQRIRTVDELIAAGEHRQAVQWVVLALDQCDTMGSKNCAKLRSLKASAHVALGEIDEARSELALAVELDREEPAYQLEYGRVLIRRGEYGLAIEHLSKAAERAPFMYKLHYYEGIALALGDELKPARQKFRYVVDNSTRDTASRARFGALVVDLIEGLEPTSEAFSELQAMGCDVRDLKLAIGGDSPDLDVDLLSFRKLAVERLDPAIYQRLAVALEGVPCE